MPDIFTMQRALARKALLQPNHRFGDLYGLVRDVYWLRTSLEAILSNNGAKTPGVDGMTKEQLEGERPRALLVEHVAWELREGYYRPSPVRRIYIPKANGKLRPLGIPTIADRMVQECLRMVLEPIYESHFLPFNDGFAFLGFQCQRKPVPQYAGRKYVLYITPTDKNIQRLKTKVVGIFATDYEDVANKIRAVNTVVRGWCNYYRHVASSDARNSLDHWLWQRMMIWLRKKHDRNLTSSELCERYLKSNRKGQQRWSCEGVSLVRPSLDVKFKHYLARKIPHPYLDSMASLTIQVEEPVLDGDVWSGASSQNRYAIDRLRRMKAVNYYCETCQKGPFPITELDAHHPSGKRDGTWHEIVILCKDCHKQTASFGVKRANRASGEPDALKGARPVRRRGKTHELGD